MDRIGSSSATRFKLRNPLALPDPALQAMTKVERSLNSSAGLAGSFPLGFRRHNQDLRQLKEAVGFMNDATHTQAGNPNSMVDQGPVRNCVYQLRRENPRLDFRWGNLPHDME